MTMNGKLQTVDSSLAWANSELLSTGISSARLDSLILLEDVMGKDRAHILAHPELHLSSAQQTRLERLVKQRREHIPLAYLRGKVMFYGRAFYVNRYTLIPRPESEDFISLLKTYCCDDDYTLKVADIGTGSGCLGITVALELQNCKVDLCDIDQRALEVAKRNARHFDISTVRYFKEDLLSSASHREYDIVLANLPYVPDGYKVNLDATFEPKRALFAGADGLDDYRPFWQQLKDFEIRPRYVLTESLPSLQHEELVAMAHDAGYEHRETCGFVQLFASA